MLTDEQIFEIVSRELNDKTLGVTEQYLEIHQPEYVDGRIKIARIDRDDKEVITVYLPVVDEYFYFAMYLSPQDGKILNVSTCPGIIVSFTVTSEDLTVDELAGLTVLSPTRTWNKGDLFPNGKAIRKFTMLEFEADRDPGELEGKLMRLLDLLEQNTSGISALQQRAETYIHCVINYHYGNQLLGCFAIAPDVSDCLAKLNLVTRFDISAWGKPFK